MNDDDFMGMAAGAAQMKVFFDSLQAAGFTEEQAIKILVSCLQAEPDE